MRKLEIAVLAFACMSPGPWAQSKRAQVPLLHLRLVDSHLVSGMRAMPTFSPIHCDQQGNIYVRFYGRGQADIFRAPIVRIAPDGEAKQTFSLSAVPGYKEAEITAFAAAPDGSLAVATWGPKVDDGHIFMFEDDGTLDSDAEIKTTSREVDQIAFFANGNLLVSGTSDARPKDSKEPTPSGPFTEILDDSGELVKQMVLPGDYAPPKPSDPAFQMSLNTLPSEITLGDAVSGSDGNVYLVRHGSTYTVYVIAHDGSLVRKLKLAPPQGGTLIGGIHLSAEGGGRIAVIAQETKNHATPRLVSVYSSQTGDRLFDYVAPRDVGSALACYSPNGLTFVGSTEQHQLAINEVQPD